jgi:hypothetical protein
MFVAVSENDNILELSGIRIAKISPYDSFCASNYATILPSDDYHHPNDGQKTDND